MPNVSKSLPSLLLAAAGAFALTPWCEPAFALVLGAAIALTVGNPHSNVTKRWTKHLLRWSVVLLGFGMNLITVLKAGRDGIGLTAITIVSSLAVGIGIAKLLRVSRNSALLISVGTAICGGSAIAAVAPVIEADDDETSIALSTVFLLNAVGLLIFPPIGHRLGLSQEKFGYWAALAIHDTSSVVGAAAKYGAIALVTGTTVKLARALWIVPLTLMAARLRRSEYWNKPHEFDAEIDASEDTPQTRISLPWFILWYVVAAAVATYIALPLAWHALSILGKRGLTLSLLLIGVGMTRSALHRVGLRPMMMGILLWIVAATLSALLVIFPIL
ncbi:MAG TPA: putative sulfate exporter family transporter [Terriglobales bacterium]|nr:putative sulfate exporter family transporter [Terriglobales bacterium]